MVELADSSLVEERLGENPLGVPAAVVVDLQEHVLRLAGRDHLVAFLQREGHRLFADDGPGRGGLGTAGDHFGVEFGVSGDDADVGLDLGEHLSIVVVEGRDAEALAKGVELFTPPVDAGDQLAGTVLSDRRGVVVGQVGETELIADAPRAYDSNAMRLHADLHLKRDRVEEQAPLQGRAKPF